MALPVDPSWPLVRSRQVVEVFDRDTARRVAEAASGPQVGDGELDKIAEALLRGELVAVAPTEVLRLDPVSEDAVPNLSQLLPDEPPPAVEKTTSFELRLVDELGVAIDGVDVSVLVDGETRVLTTDASGIVRVDNATTSFATAKVLDVAGLRDVVGPRWEQIREGEWLRESEHHSYVDTTDPLPQISLASETPHTVVVQPRVVCSRLLGAFFDTNKSFLLPAAVRHVRSIRKIYDERPNADVLIVGHTDPSGDPSYNDPLSLERADAMLAYLRDDVPAWLDWYGSGKHYKKRWGSREDNLMLTAVLAESGEALTDTPLRHFQATRGLSVDGDAGPQTREALIREYMGFDGTTLPEGIEPVVHGCGENFPPLEEDATPEQARRVELFFFDGELGPLPPPPGDNSPPGSPEYAEWRRRAAETHEFDEGAHRLAGLRVCDLERQPIAGAPCRYVATGLTATADPEGYVQIDEGIAGETCDLEWTHPGEEKNEPWPFARRVFLHFPDGEEGARRKLHNLGYPILGELIDNVLAFQMDAGLEPTGELADIEAALHDWHDGGDHPDPNAEPSPGEPDPEENKATTVPAPEGTTLLVLVKEAGEVLDDEHVSVDVVSQSGKELEHVGTAATQSGKLGVQFEGLPAGTYDITARRKGDDGSLISIDTLSGVKIKDGRARRVVRLKLGKPAESALFLKKGDKYGYDDVSEGHLNPWKSVELGEEDTVRVRVSPPGTFSQVTFEIEGGHCAVSPTRAVGKMTTLTVKGVSKGDSIVRAMRDGEEIGRMSVFSAPKKKFTVGIRRVHAKNYKVPNLGNLKIKAALEMVYKQAVAEFEMTRLPTMTVDYDLDSSESLDTTGVTFSAEAKKVIAEAKDDSFDYNIFLVAKPSEEEVGGMMDHGQRYGFVFTDKKLPHLAVPHELGHGAFSFEHTPNDTDNLMFDKNEKEAVKLRKLQWEVIQSHVKLS